VVDVYDLGQIVTAELDVELAGIFEPAFGQTARRSQLRGHWGEQVPPMERG
jgi:hypothetical protein